MRRFKVVPTVLILIIGCASYAAAQEAQQADFKMPCSQVIKLGPDKFADAYGKKTEDYSTAGQKAAFAYWINCKRPANDALAEKLYNGRNLGWYEATRAQVENAREQLNKYGGALWSLRYYEEGGGTMWGLIESSAAAEREAFMHLFIRSLAGPERKSRVARRRVKSNLARIDRWLASPKRKPFTEFQEASDNAEHKKRYEEAMDEAKSALAQLRTLLDELSDTVADRLAFKMATETKNALADSP